MRLVSEGNLAKANIRPLTRREDCRNSATHRQGVHKANYDQPHDGGQALATLRRWDSRPKLYLMPTVHETLESVAVMRLGRIWPNSMMTTTFSSI
jgi:hypothetical protein